MMPLARSGPLLVCAIAIGLMAASARAQDAPTREIVNVRGDLYTMRDGADVTIFLVTADGIILGDPLNESAAKWLLSELAARFPGKTVRYVVHSHHHFDRAGGAWVFKDTADVVGHQRFDRALSAARSELPAAFASLDRNRNRIFDESELDDMPEARTLRSRDRNEDGSVTPNELYSDIQPAESTFQQRRRIVLGGRTVDVVYTGEGHAPDMAALFFAEERVVFAAEMPPIGHSPFSFGVYSPKHVYDWVQAVMPLEFDILLSGRGEITAKADVAAFGRYFDHLVTGVRDGVESNHTRNQVRTDLIVPPAGSPAALTPQRSTHIDEVFDSFRKATVDVYIAGIVDRLARQEDYCFTSTCSALGTVAHGGGVGLAVQLGRIGVGVETHVQGEFAGTRADSFYEDSIVHRDTVWAIPFRYTPESGSRIGVSFVGGVAVVLSNVRGVSRQRFGGFPFGTPSQIDYNASGVGFSVGADVALPLTRRLGVIVPIRYRRTPVEAWTDVVSHSSLNIGAGLSWSAVRRVYMK